MVGTGIFTSLGFQVGDLPSGFAIMALWTIGGICALCGALSYAELGAALPRSGGEYHFLREIYHPAVGFVAGWISATVGFAAPVAIAAIPFGTYLAGVFPGLNPLFLVARCGLGHDPRVALGFAPRERLSECIHLAENGAHSCDRGSRVSRERNAGAFVSTREGRCGANHQLAVRSQSLLGHVCLLGLERHDLYRR